MTTHANQTATASAANSSAASSAAFRDDAFLSLLERLLSVPAPSRYEDRLAEIVRNEIRDIGLEPTTDPSGNVYVHLEGQTDAKNADAKNAEAKNAGTMLMAAHMDEVGAVVQAIDPDGRLRVDRSGRTSAKKFGEGPVEIVGDYQNIIGVLGFGTGHAASPLDVANDEFGWKSTRSHHRPVAG